MTKPKEPYETRCIDCDRAFYLVRGRIALRCPPHYQEHLTEYNRLAKRRQRQLRSLNSLYDSEGAEVGELLCGAERERAGVVAGPDVVPTAEAVRREPGKSKLFWCISGA